MGGGKHCIYWLEDIIMITVQLYLYICSDRINWQPVHTFGWSIRATLPYGIKKFRLSWQLFHIVIITEQLFFVHMLTGLFGNRLIQLVDLSGQPLPYDIEKSRLSWQLFSPFLSGGFFPISRGEFLAGSWYLY